MLILGMMVLEQPAIVWTIIRQQILLARWMDIVRELRPREIMVYTIDRETPDKTLGKYTVEEMTAFVQPLIDEGFKIQVRG